MDTPQTQRAAPSFDAPERTMLDGWLDYHRTILLWKCEGLTDEQLRRRSVPPSQLSLLGLVRHMADVERGWFADFAQGGSTPLYYTDEQPDADFDAVAEADVAADLATLRREIETCRQLVADRNLDELETDARGRSISLRWIYTHMIEEYARHNGHADLLRECVDGATGDR